MHRNSSPAISVSPLLWFWSLLGHAAMPWLLLHTRNRLKTGKEDPTRLGERFARPAKRDAAEHSPCHRTHHPGAPLLWVHAASVGESRCVLPVIEQLLASQPEMTILMTTATLTGGRTVTAHPAARTGRLIHQLCPYDAPHLLTRFLDRWQPCGLVLVESELWPGMLLLSEQRRIPVMLLNARLSIRSVRRWGKAAPLFRRLLRSCCWIMPRSEEDSRAYCRFVTSRLLPPADLKEDAPSLPFNPDEAAQLRAKLGERPVFVAASTHPGEEEIILAALHMARKTRPDLLGIIIPRHPERGEGLATRFHAPRRSNGELPDEQTPLWIADTLGELGLFFHLAERVFIGNSLTPPGGGHNPLEPLRFQRLTATGPHMQNWQSLCQRYAEALHQVTGADSLASWLVDAQLVSPPRPKRNHASTIAAQHILNTILPAEGTS